jgi:hypothetical protein
MIDMTYEELTHEQQRVHDIYSVANCATRVFRLGRVDGQPIVRLVTAAYDLIVYPDGHTEDYAESLR